MTTPIPSWACWKIRKDHAMTRADIMNWANSQKGAHLNYDGRYGAQCVDLFNYYVQHTTGVSPYSQGFGVAYAYQLFDRDSPYFTKTANIPSNANQLPQPGDAIIFANGYRGVNLGGHVAIVADANASTVTILEQNSDGRAHESNNGVQVNGSPVAQNTYTWSSIGRWCRGWLTPNNITTPKQPVQNNQTTKGGDMPATRQDIIDIYLTVRGSHPSEEEINIHLNAKSTAIDVVRGFATEATAKRQAESEARSHLQSTINTLTEQLADKSSKEPTAANNNQAVAEVVATPAATSANKMVLRTASLSGISVLLADIATSYLVRVLGQFNIDVAPSATSELQVTLSGLFLAGGIWTTQYAYKKGKRFFI